MLARYMWCVICESHCFHWVNCVVFKFTIFCKSILGGEFYLYNLWTKFLLHFLKWIFDFNHWSKSALRVMQWWHPHYGRLNYPTGDPFSKGFQFLSHKNSFFFFSYSFWAILHTIEVHSFFFKIANVQPIPLFLQKTFHICEGACPLSG